VKERLGYVKLGEEGTRCAIGITKPMAKAYIDSFASNNRDLTPPTKVLPFPEADKENFFKDK
jgi:hypothetical protein